MALLVMQRRTVNVSHRLCVLFRGLRTSSPRLSHEDSGSNLPQTVDLLETYRGLVTLGKVRYDEEQIRVVMKLRRLRRELDQYVPPAFSSHYLMGSTQEATELDAEEPWWTSNVDKESAEEMKALVRVKSHAEELAALTTPKGLLLTGPPGAGKSFLIDLWFNSFPTPYKARKHYNQLVLEIYRAVWEETKIRMASGDTVPTSEPSQPWSRTLKEQWKQMLTSGSLPRKWTRKPSMSFFSSPVSPQQSIAFAVAQRLILRHWLLVFDEVQLLDVSSATLLADVLSWFWRMGGVIVGTSNKVPDDLYMNGVQRERLEPFVEALKARCPVHVMDTQHDWRQVRADDAVEKTWFTFDQKDLFDRKVAELFTEAPTSPTLNVFGRSLHIPWSSGGVCQFTFAELCDESLGPADYLTLSSHFHTFIITSIPVLKLSAKNQARRFISLIDALYESRCKIICLAETSPDQLFFPDALQGGEREARSESDMDVMMAEAVAETRDVYRPNVSSYDAPNMAEEPQPVTSSVPLEKLSIFSGKDEQFAFKRALSRLHEMSSDSYGREERWNPLPREGRKWESSSASEYTTLAPRVRASGQHDKPTTNEVSADDYASEAAYEAQARLPRVDQRPEAPRLREHHVWGMQQHEKS
ncbi:hypothetical protein K474DRAFT_1712288 [Panus rudis PR-1116 ss-1]|nr:hypothetical protein K474DRAFT_1712288 [Panus rudis PR-1116 ss-1]